MAHWVNNLNEQALVLHDQIAAARAAEASQNIDLSAIIKLYLEKLSQLYVEQFPLATLMDSSDLIVRAKGPSTKEHAAVSSTVAWLCSEFDRRLRQLGMAALGLTGEPAAAAGHDLHVFLNGLAPGSLYLGFSLGSG